MNLHELMTLFKPLIKDMGGDFGDYDLYAETADNDYFIDSIRIDHDHRQIFFFITS